MSRSFLRCGVLSIAVTVGLALTAFAQTLQTHEKGVTDPCLGTMDKADLANVHPTEPPYSPYAGRNFPTRPYFGDTHLHSGFSMDAGAFGAKLGPREAYRFARGEELLSNTAQPVKLSRPLDFLVVADPSDGMGFFPQLMGGDPEVLATEQGKKWYDMIKGGKGADAALDIITSSEQYLSKPFTREQLLGAIEQHALKGRAV